LGRRPGRFCCSFEDFGQAHDVQAVRGERRRSGKPRLRDRPPSGRLSEFGTGRKAAGPERSRSAAAIENRHPRLRAALYMAAVAATKMNLDIRAQQQRLLTCGKAKMMTVGATMCQLVHICFGVFKLERVLLSARSPDLTNRAVSASKFEAIGNTSTVPLTAMVTRSISGSASVETSLRPNCLRAGHQSVTADPRGF
jgi:hypothetical protein